MLICSRYSAKHWGYKQKIFFLNFIYLFLERGREREREGENHQCVVASHMPPTGDLAHNPGMCPDWESNLRPFGSHASTQSTEPQQPGQIKFFKSKPVSILLRFTVHLRRQIYKQEPQCGMDCNRGVWEIKRRFTQEHQGRLHRGSDIWTES